MALEVLIDKIDRSPLQMPGYPFFAVYVQGFQVCQLNSDYGL